MTIINTFWKSESKLHFLAITIGVILPLLVLFIFSLRQPSRVEAACAPGYYCVGTTVIDRLFGCTSSCKQAYKRETVICNASSCGGSVNGLKCLESRCKAGTHPIVEQFPQTTNCCAKDSGNGNGNGNGGGGCDWATKPNVAPGTCTQANGLWGHYYRDNPIGDPRFDGGLKMERNDATVDFDWGGGSPGGNLCTDNFSTVWTGYVNLSSSGTWRFGTTSDDGMAIDLETTPGNWTRVMSDWSDHAPRTQWGSWYSLNAGWYGIRVWFYENGGGAVSQLRYERQGSGGVIIPAASLLTCSAPTGTIQGYKVLMPGNQAIAPAAGQTVYLDGGSPKTNNPYGYTTSPSSHTVSVTAPGGYMVQSTLCYNRIDCHTAACVNNGAGCPVAGAGASGSSRTVSVPSGGYADLWWHYTLVNPWVKILNGLIHANHMVTLRVAPVGQFNSRWAIFGRGSVTGTSQEGWIAPWYPERNFDLNQNTPIKAPDYATLFKRFGGGATPFTGPSLPNSSGAWVISGNKIVNGVFNQAAGTNILIFVSDDGDLTVDAEIRVPATSTIAFIVSGEIKFSKDFAGGGGGIDNLGGIYIAEGRINTAYDKTAPDEVTRQLLLEGGLISLTDTISLDRNLDPAANNTTPAEQINLSAKHYVLLKSVLGRPKFFYREVPAGF